MKITFGIDGSGIDEAIKKVEEFQKELVRKTNELCKRLAQEGVKLATAYYQIPYDGDGEVHVTWEERGDCVTAVVATGQAVLFLEFGAGYLMGYGHPEPLDYGPGTYNPSSDNWKNPNGWYYARNKKSYGNAPSAAMYTARKEVGEMIQRIAREVFG